MYRKDVDSLEASSPLIYTEKSTKPLTEEAGTAHSRLVSLNTVASLLFSPNTQEADTGALSSLPFKKSLPVTDTVRPPSIEPVAGSKVLRDGAATYSKTTELSELTEFTVIDTATSPVACAGVEQDSSVSLTYTAGTASDPNTHSNSLLNEKPEPVTATEVLP
jgi:hypothetical protein